MMKTTDETVRAVFARRDAYEKRKKQSGKVLRTVTIAALICVCLLTAAITVPLAMKGDRYRFVLDVNPSIGVDVEGGKVLSAEALNEDAEEVVKDLNVGGKSPEAAADVLIGRLTDLGYLSPEENSVLVSVEAKDPKTAENAEKVLNGAFADAMKKQEIDGAILVQAVPEDAPELNDIAEEFGISRGKAQLITQILAQNSFLTYEELAPMTVQELNVLRVSFYIDAGIQGGENVSLMSYIGEETAIGICFADAGISGTDAEDVTAVLDCRNGSIIYQVEFSCGTLAYRYRVNAVTGEILTAETSDLSEKVFFTGDKPVAVIGETASLAAALEHAEMKDESLIRCKIQRDWVDGRVVYKLSFSDGKYSCNYVLDAKAGEILKYSKTAEPRDYTVKEFVIGEDAAKRAALAEGGLIDGDLSKYSMKLTKTETGYQYALEYLCDGVKYTVTVDAATGSVIAYEKTVLKETGAPTQETEKEPIEK